MQKIAITVDGNGVNSIRQYVQDAHDNADNALCVITHRKTLMDAYQKRLFISGFLLAGLYSLNILTLSN